MVALTIYYSVILISAADAGNRTKSNTKFCSPLSVQKCAIWHKQLWIENKTLGCPCAHRAKLPQQEILAGPFSTRNLCQFVPSNLLQQAHTYLGCSVELHLPENKVALLCHSVFFNVSDKVVLFDSQTQNRAVRTGFHIFTRKKTLVVVITGIQTVRYLESLGFNSLTTVGVSLSKTPQ